MKRESSTRIFALLARSAPVGVILRRGPSKQVQLVRWNLRDDTLEHGQWLKGRIYERRCDLSPSGKLFLYFAATYKQPLLSWTAISKPPYLTALALWPKGDGWGGGGLFDTELSIQLNHRSMEVALQEGFSLKKSMKVRLYGAHPGWGEDFPIYHSLLLRNGWSLVSEGKRGEPRWDAQIVWEYSRPIIYDKQSRTGNRLRMCIKGLNQKNDAWYWIDYEVLSDKEDLLFTLPRTDWADWDGGDLVFARGGKLFRVGSKSLPRFRATGDAVLKEIADLNGLKFDAREPPPEAATW
jgi:hypothetical protein